MREWLGGLGLAVLLCAGAAGAQAPDATHEPPPAAGLVEPEGEPEGLPVEPWKPGYQAVKSTAETEIAGGLRVSVGSGALRSARGYFPVEVVLHNEGSAPRSVRIAAEGHGGGRTGLTTRQVEVGPRQRLTTWLPVSNNARGGVVRVQSPGLSIPSFSFYSMELGRPVLVVGTEPSFEQGTRLPQVEERQDFAVRFVAPEDAPRELAAYTGYVMVVVPGQVSALSAETWTVLEAYAATGGELVLFHPPRDLGQRLPLLQTSPGLGLLPYGFGHVRLCEAGERCGQALLADAPGTDGDRSQAVLPAGSAPAWQRRFMLSNNAEPLLPGVQAPVGRFLLLITLFVLAVGPGGLMLARRKGPVALLIAVPSVALVTCLAIVLWSVVVEGFSLHASRHSLVWLDRERDRAVTVGVGAYYANLEPGALQVPALGVLLSPELGWEAPAVEADWSNGMTVTGGFLPARTYREWGESAVVPTRARLALRRESTGPWVQNALGGPLEDGLVMWEGKVWRVPALADGAQGALVPTTDAASEVSVLPLLEPLERRTRRFGDMAWANFTRPLTEGAFVARLGGVGLGPAASLPVELHEAVHVLRGRVDAP